MPHLTERHHRLLGLLRSEGDVTVGGLSRRLQVGAATIRRDLHRLAQDGRVVRTYGGATLAAAVGLRSMPDPNLRWKRRIGATAADMVKDGQTIVITSGSTTLELARRLVGRQNLTVITNALDVAQVLLERQGIELILMGGTVRPKMHSLLGHLTELSARELRADTLFMGIPAISLEDGLMSDYMPEVLTDRALRQMVREVVVLADATKFDRVAPAYVFGLDQVFTIVTDSRIPPEFLARLQERGVAVAVAHDPTSNNSESGLDDRA